MFSEAIACFSKPIECSDLFVGGADGEEGFAEIIKTTSVAVGAFVREMKIGELSLEVGVGIQTIRSYERDRLISLSKRTEGETRLFGEADVSRLVLIKRLRMIGFPIVDIKDVLAAMDSETVEAVALHKVLDRISDLRGELTELEETVRSLGIGTQR